MTRDAVIAFGRHLRPDDEVVIEATGNTAMIVRLLRPFVPRVVIADGRAARVEGWVAAGLHCLGICTCFVEPGNRGLQIPVGGRNFLLKRIGVG